MAKLEDYTADEIMMVLGERDNYRAALTTLVEGFRRGREHFLNCEPIVDAPLVQQAMIWSVFTDPKGAIANPDQSPWSYESLINLMVAALERVAELEDLNAVGLDGNRRQVIR